MMILEVNNTFDERRMYLLKSHKDSSEAKAHGAPDHVFTDTWSKDFHVSPFNSRKGTYSVRANDPLQHKDGRGQFDTSITLSTSSASAKLVARVYADGPAIDPQRTSILDRFTFLLRWIWTGRLTFPRIVYQAARLSFAQGLHVWYRPEVRSTSSSRAATAGEVYVLAAPVRYL